MSDNRSPKDTKSTPQTTATTALSPQAKDTNDDEAFPHVKKFPKELRSIVLDYLAGDVEVDKSFWNNDYKKVTLFGKHYQEVQAAKMAAKASEYIILNDTAAFKEILKDYPSIINYRIAEVLDPRPRYSMIDKKEVIDDKKIILMRNKTLLQVAAAVGDFNYKEIATDKKYGITEKISNYFTKKNEDYGTVEIISKHLAPNEVVDQLKEQFPSGWENETNIRTRRFIAALTRFMRNVINTPFPAIINTLYHEHTLCFLEAKKICQPAFAVYNESLKKIISNETTTGLIFSPEILLRAISLFNNNVNQLGGADSLRSDIYWTIGYGSLQYWSLNIPILAKGVHNVFVRDKKPEQRSFSNITNFYSSRLGKDYYFDDNGEFQYGNSGIINAAAHQKFILSKKHALKRLTSELINEPKMQPGK